MVVSYVGVAYWVDFHANAAEGLHVVSMIDRAFGETHNKIIHAK